MLCISYSCPFLWKFWSEKNLEWFLKEDSHVAYDEPPSWPLSYPNNIMHSLLWICFSASSDHWLKNNGKVLKIWGCYKARFWLNVSSLENPWKLILVQPCKKGTLIMYIRRKHFYIGYMYMQPWYAVWLTCRLLNLRHSNINIRLFQGASK